MEEEGVRVCDITEKEYMFCPVDYVDDTIAMYKRAYGNSKIIRKGNLR